MAGLNINNLSDRIAQAINENTGFNNIFGRNDKALKELLGSISNGQSIMGKVLSVSDGSIQILANNVTINAKTDNSISLEKGNVVLFEVFKGDDDKVSLRPLYHNTNSQETAKVAIRQAGLPINERTLELTARRMEYGNPIDRNSLLNAFKDVMTFDDIPVKYIVDLQQMGIEVNRNNLNQYEAYLNMENSITQGMNNIVDSMLNEVANQPAFDELMNLVNEEVNAVYSSEIINDGVAIDNSPMMNESLVNATKEKLAALMDEMSAIIDKLNIDTGNDGDYSLGKIYDLSIKLKDLGLETKNVDKFLSSDFETISSKELGKTIINDIKNTLLESDNKSSLNYKSILNDPLIKEIIVKAFSSQWSINKEKVYDKKEINDLYNRLYSQTKDILDVLSNSSLKSSATETMLQNLNNNIDFMEQLNQYVPYVQIPFRSEDKTNNSELYVYKNKKSLTSGDSELSAFLHLDMDYLGSTDVLVKLKDSNISTKFTMASDEALSLVEKNIGFLDKRLNEKGYSLSSNFELSDDKVIPIREMLKNNEEHLIISRNSFDARV